MGNTLISLLILATLSPSAATQSIERAFLQNNAGMLLALMPTEGRVKLSLPEPLSFSDQLSDQQAYFLFKKIFATYVTLEFYPTRQPLPGQGRSHIFKTRWSFQDPKNNKYFMNLFFFLRDLSPDSASTPQWKISEIRAEES